jgi:opacity protein-like surface antigen
MPTHTKIIVTATALFLATATPLKSAQILFTPTLFLSEEYTDNIDLDPDNEVEDYITTAGLTLTGEVLGRTAGLELNYSPSYSKYEDNKDYDSWRHEASIYTWKEIKRSTRLELRNTFLHTNDPTDETETIDVDDPSQGPAIEGDTNRRGRNEYYTNVAEARLVHQFGSDDSFYLAYEYSILRDEDIPVGEPVDDNDISTPSAGMIYNFTTRWGMEIDTSYASTNYDDETENDRDEFNAEIRFLHNFNRTFSGFIAYNHTALDFDQDAVEDEDYQIYRPSIGIEIHFQDNAGITIDGGYYIQDFETSENEEGFNVDSDIYKRWEYRSGYFGITGSSGYEIDDDGTEDEGLTIYYEGGTTAGYSLTPRIASNIYCSYRHEDFPNETPDRSDQTLEAGVGLDWQALQWMAIGLQYNYANVTSDDPTNEYTENSAILTIRVSPTSPYRLN